MVLPDGPNVPERFIKVCEGIFARLKSAEALVDKNAVEIHTAFFLIRADVEKIRACFAELSAIFFDMEDNGFTDHLDQEFIIVEQIEEKIMEVFRKWPSENSPLV